MFLKNFILTFCLILVLSLMPGCGLAAPTPEPEPVTITFAFPQSDRAFFQQMVLLFSEQYPEVTVELQPLRGDLTATELETVDAFLAYPNEIRQFQLEGHIVNLDPFIENDESFGLNDFYPGPLQLFTDNGKTWAIPAGMDLTVMYYNRNFLDRYGVSYPQVGWTWNDFLAIAQAASDPAAGDFAYGPLSYTPDQGYIDLIHFIYQHNGRLFDDLENPTATTFDDALTIEAVQWYADLIHVHNVAPTPKQLNALGGVRLAVFRGIQAEHIGMWISSFSSRGGKFYWPDKWAYEWGMVPVPQDARSISEAWASGYAISNQTTQPDAAWRWINFLSQQMPQRELPPRRSLLESKAYEEKEGTAIVEVARIAVADSVLSPVGIEATFAEEFELFGKAVNEIMLNNTSAFEALTEAQRQIDNR